MRRRESAVYLPVTKGSRLQNMESLRQRAVWAALKRLALGLGLIAVMSTILLYRIWAIRKVLLLRRMRAPRPPSPTEHSRLLWCISQETWARTCV